MWVTNIILAMVASIDSLTIGIAYGFKNIKIPLISKTIIFALSFIFAIMAIIISRLALVIFPISWCTYMGKFLLGMLGLWVIFQAIKNRHNSNDTTGYKKKSTQNVLPSGIEKHTKNLIQDKTILNLGIKSLGITIQVIKNPVKGDIDNSGSIDIVESLILGIALSVDTLGIVSGSTLAGFNSSYLPFAISIIHLIAFCSGAYIGSKIIKRLNINKSVLSLIPGVMLLLIAIFI